MKTNFKEFWPKTEPYVAVSVSAKSVSKEESKKLMMHAGTLYQEYQENSQDGNES